MPKVLVCSTYRMETPSLLPSPSTFEISYPLCPTSTTISVIPSDFMISIWRWMSGRLQIGRSGLGKFSLNGAMRLPRPAARIAPTYLLGFIDHTSLNSCCLGGESHGPAANGFLPVVVKGAGQSLLPGDGRRHVNEGGELPYIGDVISRFHRAVLVRPRHEPQLAVCQAADEARSVGQGDATRAADIEHVPLACRVHPRQQKCRGYVIDVDVIALLPAVAIDLDCFSPCCQTQEVVDHAVRFAVVLLITPIGVGDSEDREIQPALVTQHAQVVLHGDFVHCIDAFRIQRMLFIDRKIERLSVYEAAACKDHPRRVRGFGAGLEQRQMRYAVLIEAVPRIAIALDWAGRSHQVDDQLLPRDRRLRKCRISQVAAKDASFHRANPWRGAPCGDRDTRAGALQRANAVKAQEPVGAGDENLAATIEIEYLRREQRTGSVVEHDRVATSELVRNRDLQRYRGVLKADHQAMRIGVVEPAQQNGIQGRCRCYRVHARSIHVNA